MRVPSLTLQLVGALVLFVWVSVSCALASCPSNGNTHVVYVTSNVGDNIWSFSTTGNFIGNALNKQSFPFRIDKLRDMKFGPGGHLYITSARGQFSRVFAVSGNGLLNNTLNHNCTRDYLFTVTTQSKEDPFLDHPYSIAFDPDDDTLYVSNQNSITITKYIRQDTTSSGSNSKKFSYPEWKPAPNVDQALPSDTFPDIKVPSNAGLFASSWSGSYSLMSVRGVALSPLFPRSLVESAAPAGWFASDDPASFARYILVSDIAANQIHVFSAKEGNHLFVINVPSPVQVLFPSAYQNPRESGAALYFNVPHVYVTSKDDGMVYLVPFVAPQTSETTGVPHPSTPYAITGRSMQHSASGIYENPSHDMLLIADRNGRKITTYASPFLSDFEVSKGPSPFLGYFVSDLPDQPEFVLTTVVEHQSNIPFCYELNEDGTFRYVALCTAAYIWTVLLMLFFLAVLGVVLAREICRCREMCAKRKRKRHPIHEVPSSEETPLVAGAAPSGGVEGMGAGYGTSA